MQELNFNAARSLCTVWGTHRAGTQRGQHGVGRGGVGGLFWN